MKYTCIFTFNFYRFNLKVYPVVSRSILSLWFYVRLFTHVAKEKLYKDTNTNLTLSNCQPKLSDWHRLDMRKNESLSTFCLRKSVLLVEASFADPYMSPENLLLITWVQNGVSRACQFKLAMSTLKGIPNCRMLSYTVM